MEWRFGIRAVPIIHSQAQRSTGQRLSIAETCTSRHGIRIKWRSMCVATGSTNEEVKEFLQHHTTTMTQHAGTVVLQAKGDAFLSNASLRIEIDYTIEMPAKMDAAVNDALGNVDASGLSANLVADVALGNVRLTRTTGMAEANSTDGNVDARQCAGTLKLSSGHGNIGISQFNGDTVNAQTAMGNVTADFPSTPEGRLHFANGHGQRPSEAAGNRRLLTPCIDEHGDREFSICRARQQRRRASSERENDDGQCERGERVMFRAMDCQLASEGASVTTRLGALAREGT